MLSSAQNQQLLYLTLRKIYLFLNLDDFYGFCCAALFINPLSMFTSTVKFRKYNSCIYIQLDFMI